MTIFDYFRLGTATMLAHKKQALLVIFVASLPFVLLVVCLLVFQSLQNSIMTAMLAPTNGQVLLSIRVDPDYCQKDCNLQDNLTDIRQNLSENHGQLLDSYIVTTELGTFTQLPDFPVPAQNLPDDTITIAAPIETAARLANIELPKPNASPEAKLETIKAIRQETLQKVIIDQDQAYYLATLLPTDVFAHNLSFSSTNQDHHPLSLILANFRTAPSANLIFGEIPDSIPRINSTDTGTLFAAFTDIQSASNFFHSDINFCDESNRILGECSDNYRYQVSPIIGSPINAYQNFQEIWSVFGLIAIVISIFAAIVIASTYVRLVNKDTQTIALYYAMGAHRYQVVSIYLTYLLILSILVTLFVTIAGLVISSVISCFTIEPLSQAFTLAFGTIGPSHLTACSWSIAALCGFVLLLAPISILLSASFLTNKKLVKNLTI